MGFALMFVGVAIAFHVGIGQPMGVHFTLLLDAVAISIMAWALLKFDWF